MKSDSIQCSPFSRTLTNWIIPPRARVHRNLSPAEQFEFDQLYEKTRTSFMQYLDKATKGPPGSRNGSVARALRLPFRGLTMILNSFLGPM